MSKIIHTNINSDLTEDFVAIGTYLNDEKEPYHSVLIIQYAGVLQHFHYTGRALLLDDIYNNDCFHIKTAVVNKALVPSFLGMCRRILKKANPQYGYFYSGDYYDVKGVHFANNHVGEVMTCVGLCLNVLKGFLGRDYMSYEDWTDTSTVPTGFLEYFANRNGLDINKIRESHRRITPSDLLCSAYFKSTPISKQMVDSKRAEVLEYLKNY